MNGQELLLRRVVDGVGDVGVDADVPRSGHYPQNFRAHVQVLGNRRLEELPHELWGVVVDVCTDRKWCVSEWVNTDGG